MMEERLEKLETRVASLEVRASGDSVRDENIERRLGAIEGDLKWVIRLIVGAIIMAVIGFALKGGFNVG